MKNGEVRNLCAGLLHAESEQEVIRILDDAGLWSDPALWRHYGDLENNWGQGGNQQSLAEAALAEKIVNSVDARLTNECLVRGIDPKKPDSARPKTIREAVARFFEGGTGEKMATGGLIEDWSDEKIREIAQGITLCATGTRPTLNLTISDVGEGQTPDKLPETILSLSKSNKMYIPFVQGQFNQGGTGALRFCGQRNFQLVISRRNPALLGSEADERDAQWGFTIVRRERPGEATDGRRNSTYTFLAPVGVGDMKTARHGDVLSFSADSLGIFPDREQSFGRAAPYGTAIKLYDYQFVGQRSNILRKSLLQRLELLLPEIALPSRLYEFRRNPETGKVLPPGSRETTLVGLRRRLINNNENVEPGFPLTIPFSPRGEQLTAEVYVFKPEGSERETDGDEDEDPKNRKKLGGIRSYRKQEGVVFVRNGQTQGHLPRDYFKREALKLRPIAAEMLVFVDCDRLSDDVREDLFMPSRDRLTDNAFKQDLIAGLDQALRSDEMLKQIRNQRQQEHISERLKDDRPLTEVLQTLIKHSPNLTQLLHLGQRISAPFNTVSVGGVRESEFKGEIYPTYFKMKGVEYGAVHKRPCPINQRMRLTFETDARDDYFTRKIERGVLGLTYLDNADIEHGASSWPKLKRGIASVMADLPEGVAVGDVLTFTARVTDLRAAFDNRIEVTVKPAAQPHESGSDGARKTPQQKSGADRELPQQLAMPQIIRVYRDQWEDQSPPFGEFTAMRACVVGYEGEDERDIYEFRINMDNTPLLNEIKQRRLDDSSARNQFLYANVLVGLSLLLEGKKSHGAANSEGGADIEARIDQTTTALAPFILALTSLGQEDLSEGDDDLDGLESATA